MYLYDGKLSTVRLVWHFCVLVLYMYHYRREGGGGVFKHQLILT